VRKIKKKNLLKNKSSKTYSEFDPVLTEISLQYLRKDNDIAAFEKDEFIDEGYRMTPVEYLKIEKEQESIIEIAENKIADARRLADQCDRPKTLQLAVADDIVRGAVIWHKPESVPSSFENEQWFWNIVNEPLHYGDSFKAYTADDGCRYGLEGAYVVAQEELC